MLSEPQRCGARERDKLRAVHDNEAIKAGWAAGELVDYFYAAQADRDLVRRGYYPVRSPTDDPFYAIKAIRHW